MTTAVVIIDVQKAILRGLGPATRQGVMDAALSDMVARLTVLQRAAHATGTPVVMIQHDGDPSHRLAPDTEGWEIRDELTPTASDIVVHKTSCDSFYETELDRQLRARNIDHLVIGGCMTQFCVDTTCRRAVSMGFDVTLLADGHMTADMGDLKFQQIIAHHNALLDGFNAGTSSIKLAATNTVQF